MTIALALTVTLDLALAAREAGAALIAVEHPVAAAAPVLLRAAAAAALLPTGGVHVSQHLVVGGLRPFVTHAVERQTSTPQVL